MPSHDKTPTADLLRKSFELTLADSVSEEELLQALAFRIEDMLAREPEHLMSMLYRLDVLEEKIIPVMRPDAPEPIPMGLAKLVLERQKQRMATKQSVKSRPIEGLEGWEW